MAADAPNALKPARNPRVYHFKIGEIDAWSISDGHMLFRDPLNLMWPEEDRPQMKTWLEERGESRMADFPRGLATAVSNTRQMKSSYCR